MESPSVLVAGVDRMLTSIGNGSSGPHRVLDLGGGTGGQAVRLATAGHDVTVVDPSPDALAALARRASEQGVALRALQGDAENLADLVPTADIDLVLCHGVLEVVDNPGVALAAIRSVLRPEGHLSLLVTQREAGVLLRVASGHVRAAHAILGGDEGRWGPADPLLRRFTRAAILALLEQSGFQVLDSEGVRVFSDLVPVAAGLTDPSATALLAEMEQVAATIAALRDVATQLHLHARPGDRR